MENGSSDRAGSESASQGSSGLLRHPVSRRNLLFGLTLLTLVLVFVGAVPLGEALMTRPLGFFFYWMACFVLVVLVLVLAFYDLMRVRREHARRVRDLEKEFAAAAEEARRLMRENREKGE